MRFADTDPCLGILSGGSFGFVHQVLTYCRMPEGVLTPEFERYRPGGLVRYLMALEHAHRYLLADEAKAVIRRKQAIYYDDIAEAALRLPGQRFWRFHREALDDIGVGLGRPYMAWRMAAAAFRELLLAPYHIFRFLVRRLRRTARSPCAQS